MGMQVTRDIGSRRTRWMWYSSYFQLKKKKQKTEKKQEKQRNGAGSNELHSLYGVYIKNIKYHIYFTQAVNPFVLSLNPE